MAFCSKVGGKIRSWFKRLDEYLLNNTKTAITAVSRFKVIIDSPVVDILTTMIPGSLDDKIKEALRKAVNLSIDRLIVLSGCNDLVTTQDKLLCYANFLSGLPKEVRDAQLFKFASLITKELDESRFDQKEYDLVTQSVYTTETF